MRALITGVAGQDGTLLTSELKAHGFEIFGTKLPFEKLSPEHEIDTSNIRELDVSDQSQCQQVLTELQPDVIFHFAAISSVGISWAEPALTMHINVRGTANLIEAIQKCSPASHLIHAASTEIFDASYPEIDESTPLKPKSPYAISKAAAFELCNLYRDRGLHVTNVIMANHESPLRTTDFVTGKIALGVAQIAAGLADSITLGNLDVSKNWSAAKDFMVALRKISELKFNENIILANSNETSLKQVLAAAFKSIGISDWSQYVLSSEEFTRKNEIKSIKINASKSRKVLNWEATTSTDEWVSEMVQYHLNRLAASN